MQTSRPISPELCQPVILGLGLCTVPLLISEPPGAMLSGRLPELALSKPQLGEHSLSLRSTRLQVPDPLPESYPSQGWPWREPNVLTPTGVRSQLSGRKLLF